MKLYAIAALGVIALVVPLLEVAITGRSEPLGAFWIAQTLLGLSAIYWWYHQDKRERQYQASPLMDVSMVALTVIALPIYFVRSRGWKGGASATGIAVVIFAVMMGLEWLGQAIGAAIR
jgi:hypothetical protein